MNRKIYSLIVPSLIILIWFISTQINIVSSLLLPSPHAVVVEFLSLVIFKQNNIVYDFIVTVVRVFASFISACIIGIPIGLLMGYYKKIYDALEFIVEFFRAIPTTALFPLFLLFFGVGNLAKIAMGAWTSLLILIINSMYGVKHAKKLRIMVAKTMKVKRTALFTKVILPEAMPNIVAGMRIALSLTLIVIIVVEMFIGSNSGLGYRIINAQLVYETPEMYAVILHSGVLGYFLNRTFIFFEKRFVHWAGK